jgi:probable rRNA maturation factor
VTLNLFVLPNVEIMVESALWNDADLPHDLVKRAVWGAFLQSGLECHLDAEVSVVLADDARLRELNRTWRGKDAPTNVLSFPAWRDSPEEAPLLGDVVVAYETTAREAEVDGKPFQHHLAHLVVHGTLHLLGFDHETGEADAERMEATERAALAGIGIPDPYADTVPLAADEAG